MANTRFQRFFNNWCDDNDVRPYRAAVILKISVQTAYQYSNGNTFPHERKAIVLAKMMKLKAHQRDALLALLIKDRQTHGKTKGKR